MDEDGDDGVVVVDGERRPGRRRRPVTVYVVVVPGGGVLFTWERASSSSLLQQRGLPILSRRGEDPALGGLYLLRQRLPDHRPQRGDLDLRCTWSTNLADTLQNSHRLSYYTINDRLQIHGQSGPNGGTSKDM